jgi:NAD(P)-dependent dehydrogenase (short-subunit alcohol dehydrogenase family)
MTQAHTPPDWLGLSGRVCVVTGAASGIGAAVAHGLADVGAQVALLDRNADACAAVAQLLCSMGARAVAVACDVTSEAAVCDAAMRIKSELGPVAGLVNNAGMLKPGSLDEVPLAEWNAVLALNLTGYLLCGRTFARQMREGSGGAIVNVASISAHYPQTRSGAYSASKAAILQLSRQMAAEWGPDGIRSNVVCPGMIRTALSAGFYAQPGVEQKRAGVTASRRIGEPEDIANAALFLLSDRAGYMNGAEFLVDGGMDCMLMDLVPRPGFNDQSNSERKAA